MADPVDMIIPMLREMREEMREGFARVWEEFAGVHKRLEAQKDALTGETILGRYAAKEVEERLAKLEQEVAELRRAALSP
jgi:hypothetical protein